MKNDFLTVAQKQFEYYKMLGEKTLLQLSDEQLFWRFNEESNSAAMIVQHLAGNMRSRWTDFLDTDGEKPWRDREAEFEPKIESRAELLAAWQAGWACLFSALEGLTEADLSREIFIRNQGHTVAEAILRQLAHYPYHVGQLVFIGKMLADGWSSLSIPRGKSAAFNAEKFAEPPRTEHFLATLLEGKKGS